MERMNSLIFPRLPLEIALEVWNYVLTLAQTGDYVVEADVIGLLSILQVSVSPVVGILLSTAPRQSEKTLHNNRSLHVRVDTLDLPIQTIHILPHRRL